MSFDFDLKSSTAEKLIDVVSSAIGKLSAPYLLRKMAEAKGHEIVVLSESIEKARLAIGREFKIDLSVSGLSISEKTFDLPTIHNQLQRIDDRIKMIEAERQKNIDKVTLYAFREAARITCDASEKPVDKDWMNRFLNVTQDVSEDQMQEVWGKVLAGEVNKPGTFSLRTMELLKNLSKGEAELFRQYVQFRVTVDDNFFYVFPNTICDFGGGCRRWSDSVFLRELRLVQTGIYTITFVCAEDEPLKFQYGGQSFQLYGTKTNTELSISCFPFTSSGEELSKLIEIMAVPGYFDCIKNVIISKGFNCRDDV